MSVLCRTCSTSPSVVRQTGRRPEPPTTERQRGKVGGEGGIRTHVPLTGQDAFEAPPLRPLLPLLRSMGPLSHSPSRCALGPALRAGSLRPSLAARLASLDAPLRKRARTWRTLEL